jgi:hypothetical protein
LRVVHHQYEGKERMSSDYAEVNYGFRWVSCLYGGPAVQVSRPVVVSTILKPGLAVCQSYTSGSIRLAAEGDTSLFGVATHNLTTTATEGSTFTEVIPFLPGYIWEARAAAGMAGGAAEDTCGRFLDLEIPTTSRHRVDTGASTKMFVQVGYHPTDYEMTGQGKRLWMMIRNTTTQFGEMQGET